MKRYAQSHANTRSQERFNLNLSAMEYRMLCAKIGFYDIARERDCVMLQRWEARCVYAVWMKGEWIPLVFDHDSAIIVTVLPPEELRKHREKLPW